VSSVYSASQKWVFAATALAVFSMFLPWIAFGRLSSNGWREEYFFVLIFWAVPCFNAYKGSSSNIFSKISMVLGGLALVIFIPSSDDSIYLLGKTYSSRVGAGAYIYLASWGLGLYSEFILSRNPDKQRTTDIKHSVTDENMYLEATQEVEGEQKDPALWAKCMAICDGDPEKAKYEYIRTRVSTPSKAASTPSKEVKLGDKNSGTILDQGQLDKALLRSVQSCYYKEVEKHLSDGANPYVENESGKSAYQIALDINHDPLIRVFDPYISQSKLN